MDFSMREYMKNVDILQKNKENVPIELLKTKYAKGYNEIRCRIAQETKSCIFFQISAGMRILEADKQEEMPKILNAIQKIIDENDRTLKEISRIIFKEYDVEKAMNLAADKIAVPAWEKAYGPYFRKKCRLEAGVYICDLLPEMIYDMECGVWIGKDMSFTLMMPPV